MRCDEVRWDENAVLIIALIQNICMYYMGIQLILALDASN
jgi:hypothetical protein